MKSPHSPILPVLRFPLSAFPFATLAALSLVTPAFAVVNIDYVTIGNAGNAADAATGSLYGAVTYAYQIAKNETTIAQYAEFLNAVAKTDTYGLYSSKMPSGSINGITQSGGSGSFIYAANPGSGTKPITHTSWFDAARFCNWMHNGQPVGSQTLATTEGGAYTLNGATSGVSISKNVGATVWIPSESEWYKAAYYDPNKGGPGLGGYWAQATQSDTVAGNTVGVATSANFYDGDFVGSGTSISPSANALTNVGAYGVNSASAYGTNDQAGNVWEWNDTVIGAAREMRGGSWLNGLANLPASFHFDIFAPTSQFGDVGFRVAAIPEPTSIFLTLLASGALPLRRKRG